MKAGCCLEKEDDHTVGTSTMETIQVQVWRLGVYAENIEGLSYRVSRVGVMSLSHSMNFDAAELNVGRLFEGSTVVSVSTALKIRVASSH